MSQNFFNPYELVKKKGREDKDSMLEALKKKHAAKPTPMDIELPAKIKSGHTMDMEIPLTSKSGAVSAATKIGKIVRAFLARRRILRQSVGEFQKKVRDLELMLVKIPAIRNKQFLKDAKLSEMMGLATKVWLTGFKQIFTNGVARKKVSVQQDLRNTIMALIFKLNDMIVMSFDKKTGKRSLIMYLLEEQSENVKLFISVITYLKIVKKIDTSLDYIQSASWKKSVAQFYFTLFDTEDFILSSRYITFKGSLLDLARDLHSEVIERMGCQKSFALSMYAYLKVNPADTGNMMKSYLLLIYFDHFLCRHIIKSDPSFISQHQLYSNLNYSFECCFGYPMAAKHFYKEALKHPKLHETFVDLLDHLPNGPLNAIKTVTFDSKLNFTVNMTHLLISLLQDPEPPTEITLRALLELLNNNLEEYITKNLFTMILDTLSGDPAYNFISSTLTSCFSAAIMKRVYSMIVENSRPNINVAVESETRMLMSKFMVFFLYMANKTGNGSLYTSGIIGIASNHAFMKDLFEAVTKKMMLGSRDTTYFDSADLQFELDVPSFTLFLEAFHKFLITSEISWQQTEKIAPKKSLKNFVVFLKNVLLSTYIQNYLTGADSITFQFTFSNGAEILSLLKDINEEQPYIEDKWFRARPDQLEILQNTMALVNEMDEQQINKQLEVIKKLPFCYPFELKYVLFQQILRALKSRNHQYSEVEVKIRRDHLIFDTVEAFKKLKGNTPLLRGMIKICFIDELGMYESGIDTGGILKEFLYEAAKHMLNPEYGLFIEMKDRELDPNPESKAVLGVEHLLTYYVVGVIVGRAIYEEILLDSVFSKIMLRRMLNKPNFFNHLSLFDADLYQQLLKVKYHTGNIEEFGLSFSTNVSGSDKEVELMRGGSQVPVTNENKIRYIYYLTHYYLNARTREQTKAFLTGMSEIIPLPILQIFTTKELQTMISGEDAEINISDLEDNCKYSGGFGPQDPYIKQFWQIVRSLPSEDKYKLLKFVTNCRRPPVFGFKNLNPPFMIQMLEENQQGAEARLPIAAVCFNTLKLPRYTSADILKSKLIQALNSGSGYYII